MSDNYQDEPADDMSEYLQTFLDETDEQLDDLVETMLALEQDVTNEGDLNEAFRLIHSIKGSAGMMGFDNITVLTHHLENRFERFRSGHDTLDEPTMNLVLRCIDFLRQCNDRLRSGGQLGGASELLEELKRAESKPEPELEPELESAAENSPESALETPEALAPVGGDKADTDEEYDEQTYKVEIRFRPGLPLVDLKAQLIASRLGRLGEVLASTPPLETLADVESLERFQVRVEYDGEPNDLREAADVDGVEAVEIVGAKSPPADAETQTEESAAEADNSEDAASAAREAELLSGRTITASASETSLDLHLPAQNAPEHEASVVESPSQPSEESQAPMNGTAVGEDAAQADPPLTSPVVSDAAPQQASSSKPKPSDAASKIGETMRVDIDRLDNLMNLAGELVVNRARFVQISNRIDPALRKSSMENRIRDLGDGMRRAIESLKSATPDDGESSHADEIRQLQAGLELLDEQAEVWQNGRQCLGEMTEAIDQLSRVSHGLQRGVLDTRMVPVGPLFNRFKRVVRDLSKERGKQVELVIRGEKTELDKRMIDELGDPLVHLVRNSIDHGMEAPEIRLERGKDAAGVIQLEANHSGNNVFIRIRDDGGGIKPDRIRERLIQNGVLSETAANGLSDAESIEYIWHPGFSTAKEVTDVSGRGVGMDVVKTRIGLLNGTIEVESTVGKGTCFTIRLPLTLAIIDCLLIRLRGVVFSLPIDDVREIVSIPRTEVRTIQGKRTFEVRGEFLPLFSIDDVFHWHGVDHGHATANHETGESTEVDVVVLNAAGKTIGLLVDEMLGSQDIVIKSLSQNFMNIRGLSGASILGDGSVCLMLDVGRMMDLSMRSARSGTEEAAN